MECTASWGPIEFGPCQSDWNPVTESDKPESSFTWLDTEPVLDFGTEFYFFAGFTINLSVDLETIDEGLVKIFE